MRFAWLVIRTLWCLGGAYLPVATTRINSRLLAEIGCKPFGDCYLPGTSASFELDILAILLAVVIWPVSVWFLGGKFFVQRFQKSRHIEDRTS